MGTTDLNDLIMNDLSTLPDEKLHEQKILLNPGSRGRYMLRS